MSARTPSSNAAEASGPSRLRVSVDAPSHPARAAALLGGGRSAWLGPAVDRVGGRERYLVDLELRVIDHRPRVAFRKAAFIDLPPGTEVTREGDAISLPISWRAAGMAPLFPVFAGTLSWAHDRLHLDGYYEPPGGGVGVVMDRLMLGAAARVTARRLLGRIAEELREGQTGPTAGPAGRHGP